jgi:hypothetical protein
MTQGHQASDISSIPTIEAPKVLKIGLLDQDKNNFFQRIFAHTVVKMNKLEV